MRIIIYMAAALVLFLIIRALIGEAGAFSPDYSIVGPTISPDMNVSSMLINNSAFNETNLALFGPDPQNTTLANVSISSWVGGLTVWFAPIGPLFVMIIAAVIGAVIYSRSDGDFTPITYLLIITGATTGATTYAFQSPPEYYLVAAFMMGLGIAANIYKAIIGKG